MLVRLLLPDQVEMILRNLGLYNAKDTIVGNNDLRGVSGGERRRVTMGEWAGGREDARTLISHHPFCRMWAPAWMGI